MSIPLTQLKKSIRARITAIASDESMKQKIIEMGLCEGLEVTLLHEGPFGRDPIAVLVEGHVVAMRRSEAATVTVEIL
ncbi:MAG: ferrous iron transport protein A [Alphaproteobacteria bacterium]|nr:ferrous iron transport protein A [Alphaproteobacteria bacterium]